MFLQYLCYLNLSAKLYSNLSLLLMLICLLETDKIHHFKRDTYGSLFWEVSFWVQCLHHLTVWYDHMTFNLIMLWFTQNVSSLFEKPCLAIVSYFFRSYWIQLVIYIWYFLPLILCIDHSSPLSSPPYLPSSPLPIHSSLIFSIQKESSLPWVWIQFGTSGLGRTKFLLTHQGWVI